MQILEIYSGTVRFKWVVCVLYFQCYFLWLNKKRLLECDFRYKYGICWKWSIKLIQMQTYEQKVRNETLVLINFYNKTYYVEQCSWQNLFGKNTGLHIFTILIIIKKKIIMAHQINNTTYVHLKNILRFIYI